MRITAFNGSPKGKASNTEVMVGAFLEGAVTAGAQVENIYLADKNINYCQRCFQCVSSEGICAIEDDMQDLLIKYVESDIVVIATPLMIDNISGMLKVFLDRTFCIGNLNLEKDENGESRRVRSKRFENIKPAKMVVIANGGYPERTNFQVLELLMKRAARNFNMEVIAEIYKPQGVLLTSKIKRLQPKIEYYKKLLNKAGQEVTMDMKLSGETERLLEEDFLPIEEYFQLMNISYTRRT
jgi:multimeric flavodoxin WrbA